VSGTDGYGHVSICIDPEGHVSVSSQGDPDAIAEALQKLARLFIEKPETIDCASGGCRQHVHVEAADEGGRPS